MSEAYQSAGVNLELGDELSKMLYEASKQTWANRSDKFGEPAAAHDSFSGLRGLSFVPLLELPDPELITFYMGDDGVGTKVEVAQRVGDHSTIAFDLLAMVCDDAAIRGYEPAAVTTTLDVHKLTEEMRPAMAQLALGYIAAANAAQVALVNGEVAELGTLVGGYGEADDFKYNWSATVVAVGHQSRLLDGSKVRTGDSIVGLREDGFRSNGLSLVRKTLTKTYGPKWHQQHIHGQALGELVLQPSKIYTSVLVDAVGGYDLRQEPKAEIHGAAHITGGGIPGKLGRLLESSGLGADIDTPFLPSYLMNLVQNLAEVPDEEIYRVFNMGQGMAIVTPEPEKVIRLAESRGVGAKIIGTVTQYPEINIRSVGSEPGKKLHYN